MRSRFVLGGLALVLSVLIAPVNADASVWISPPSHNDGICFRELFEHADQWEETRTLIDGVFYSSQDLDTYFTQEEYDSWFPMVTNWGLEFGLEVSSLKAGATNAAIVFNAEKILWDNFLSSGVAISEMTMDEPLWGIKELNAQGNAWATDAYAADEAAKFIKLVRANYPGILIGDTEPYPP